MAIPIIDEVSSRNAQTAAVTVIAGTPQIFVSPLGIGAAPKVLSVPTANSAANGTAQSIVTATLDPLAETAGVQFWLTAAPLTVYYKQLPAGATVTVPITPAGAYSLQIRSEAGFTNPKSGGGFYSAWSSVMTATIS